LTIPRTVARARGALAHQEEGPAHIVSGERVAEPEGSRAEAEAKDHATS
jgi:hypothetical protein